MKLFKARGHDPKLLLTPPQWRYFFNRNKWLADDQRFYDEFFNALTDKMDDCYDRDLVEMYDELLLDVECARDESIRLGKVSPIELDNGKVDNRAAMTKWQRTNNPKRYDHYGKPVGGSL